MHKFSMTDCSDLMSWHKARCFCSHTGSIVVFWNVDPVQSKQFSHSMVILRHWLQLSHHLHSLVLQSFHLLWRQLWRHVLKLNYPKKWRRKIRQNIICILFSLGRANKLKFVKNFESLLQKNYSTMEFYSKQNKAFNGPFEVSTSSTILGTILNNQVKF